MQRGYGSYVAVEHRDTRFRGEPLLSHVLRALQARLTGPVGFLLHTGSPLNWFVTIATDAPFSAAARAARCPARPAPMIRTSCEGT